MATLYDTATMLYVPSGYKASKVYGLKPTGADGEGTATRSTISSRINSSGVVEESVAINTIAHDYGSVSSPLNCPEAIVSPDRTNHLLKSNVINTGEAEWLGTASSGTAITSPNGLTEGEEIVFSSSASDYVGQRPTGLSAGVEYTFFFWVRIADGGTAKDIRIQHYDGTSTNLLASPTISSNEWVKVSYTFTATADATERVDIKNCTPGVAGSIYVWGANVQKSGTDMHIKTDTSTASRSFDIIAFDDLQTNNVFSNASGTFFFYGTIGVDSSNNDLLSIWDTTTNNRIILEGGAFKSIVGGSAVTGLEVLTPATNDRFTGAFAIAWDSSSCRISVNGATADASGLTSFAPATYSDLRIYGSGQASTTRIKAIAGWNAKLTQTELNTLTAL